MQNVHSNFEMCVRSRDKSRSYRLPYIPHAFNMFKFSKQQRNIQTHVPKEILIPAGHRGSPRTQSAQFYHVTFGRCTWRATRTTQTFSKIHFIAWNYRRETGLRTARTASKFARCKIEPLAPLLLQPFSLRQMFHKARNFVSLKPTTFICSMKQIIDKGKDGKKNRHIRINL